MGLKEVILSADGDSVVYSVPDAVANNLESYCIPFAINGCKQALPPRNTKSGAFIAIMRRILLII